MVLNQVRCQMEPYTIEKTYGDIHVVRGDETGERMYVLEGTKQRLRHEHRSGTLLGTLLAHDGELLPRSEVISSEDRDAVYQLSMWLHLSKERKLHATRGSVNGTIGILPKEQ